MSGATGSERSKANSAVPLSVREAILAAPRGGLLIDALGFVAIVACVPLGLSGEVSITQTAPWSLLIAVLVLSRLARPAGHRVDRPWVWLLGLAWAALPWLAFPIQAGTSALILAFLCGYGLIIDTVEYRSNVPRSALPAVLCFGSYSLALAVQQHWLPLIGLALFTTHVVCYDRRRAARSPQTDAAATVPPPVRGNVGGVRSSRPTGEELGRAVAALESGQIIAWAQPIYDLRTRVPVGVELLARWPQPDGQMVSPGTFVPWIESQGRADQLAETMVAQAVALLGSLDRGGDQERFVTVNVGAQVLMRDGLADEIAQQLDAADVSPRRLILELTESERLPDDDLARDAIERLRRVGIGVASDDLGAGWSSLNQMVQNAFSHIKIDRTLTNADREGAFELLQALQLMAAGADQTVIAEGIETPASIDRVTDAGIVLGQGYLLGRPQPIPEVLTLLLGSAATITNGERC